MTQPFNPTPILAAGFRPAATEVPRRLIVSAAGRAKDGKTHFALTFPAPIFFFDIDIGTEGVVEKFRTGQIDGQAKEIYIYTIRIPKGALQTTYEQLWTDAKEKLKLAWGAGRGTVITDTGTELYELNRLARFGKLTQVLPHHYTEVNAEWRELLRWAYDAEQMNTVFIHKLKPKYVNNTRTNEYEIAGFGEMEYMTQLNVVCYRDFQVTEGLPFRAYVKDCRRNPLVAGATLQGPMLNGDTLLRMVHG